MPTAAPLRARDLTVVRGPLTVLDGVDLVVAAGRAHRPRRAQRRRQVDAAAGPRRARAARARPRSSARRRRRPSATCPRSRRARRRDGDRVPRPAHRRGRRRRPSSTRRRPTSPPGPRAPTTATPTRSNAGWRSAAPTSTPASARSGPTSGSRARCSTSRRRSLSGGEAARAGLAALLLARFDVFLLDEPTNDLDLDGLDRLERWSRELQAAVVLVSHDRAFLPARSPTSSSSTSSPTGPTMFGGGWQAFLDEREAARRARVGALRGVRHQAASAGRAGPARAGVGDAGPVEGRRSDRRDGQEHPRLQDQPDRAAGRPGGPHGEGDGAARGRRQAARAVAAAPDGRRRPAAAATSSPASTAPSSSAATFTLGPIDLTIGAGERVALVGPNGSRARRRCSTPCSGAPSSAAGRGVRSGRASSSARSSRPATSSSGSTIAAAARSRTRPGMDAADVRTLLAKFGLVADHVTRPTATLSPGERTRALLALLMANGANCSCSTSRRTTSTCRPSSSSRRRSTASTGTVLLVTHDRSLLERVRLTRASSSPPAASSPTPPSEPAAVRRTHARHDWSDRWPRQLKLITSTTRPGRSADHVLPWLIDRLRADERFDARGARPAGLEAADVPGDRRDDRRLRRPDVLRPDRQGVEPQGRRGRRVRVRDRRVQPLDPRRAEERHRQRVRQLGVPQQAGGVRRLQRRTDRRRPRRRAPRPHRHRGRGASPLRNTVLIGGVGQAFDDADEPVDPATDAALSVMLGRPRVVGRACSTRPAPTASWRRGNARFMKELARR